MELSLNNKKVLITGSTKGIGFETARQFVKEGCQIYLNGREKTGLLKAMEKLNAEFPQAQIKGYAADFSDEKSITELIANCHDVDILINNVGIFQSQNFSETADADWNRMWEVNVMSGVRLCREIFPKLLSRGWGRVVFVSSECAQLVPADLVAYSATKAALHAISKGLSQQTKGTGVTVNTLMPGSTLSDGAERFLDDLAAAQNTTIEKVEEQFFREVRTTSQLSRFLKVEEVAKAIVFLCSDSAAGINGSVLRVDGGSVGGIF